MYIRINFSRFWEFEAIMDEIKGEKSLTSAERELAKRGRENMEKLLPQIRAQYPEGVWLAYRAKTGEHVVFPDREGLRDFEKGAASDDIVFLKHVRNVED